MDAKLKTCLVTGCSEGGVGAAFAEAFQQKGYYVFATARSPSKVPKTLHDASNVTVLALDTGSSTSIAEAAKVVERQTRGKLDVLINNAGVGQTMPALDVSLDDARNLFKVNFFGVLEMVQVFSPMLIKAKGCIVNNASVGGLSPIPFNSMSLSAC
jgi:short-subunit dehydrogenase